MLLNTKGRFKRTEFLEGEDCHIQETWSWTSNVPKCDPLTILEALLLGSQNNLST